MDHLGPPMMSDQIDGGASALDLVAEILNQYEDAGALELEHLNRKLRPPLFLCRFSGQSTAPPSNQPIHSALPAAIDIHKRDGSNDHSAQMSSADTAENYHVPRPSRPDATMNQRPVDQNWGSSNSGNMTSEDMIASQVTVDQPNAATDQQAPTDPTLQVTRSPGQQGNKRSLTDTAAARPIKVRRKSATSRPLREQKEAQASNCGLLGTGAGAWTFGQLPSVDMLTVMHTLHEQKVHLAKEAFLTKWGKATKAVGDWNKLAGYAYIAQNKDYGPYEELDDLMSRVWETGRARVQCDFRENVHAWINDHAHGAKGTEVPPCLKKIDGFDEPVVIQHLYVAMELVETCRVEGPSRLLTRWTLARLVDRYEATVLAVQSAVDQGKIKLARGHRAPAVAKVFILQIMCMTQNQKSKTWESFRDLLTKGRLWNFLSRHYKNSGILAIFPEKQTRVGLRYHTRWPALLDILDLLRPEFHGPQLQLYSQIINQMGQGEIPDQALLSELESRTAPAQAALELMDCPVLDSNDATHPLFASKEHEKLVQSLPELDRENLILDQCVKFQQGTHDNILGFQFQPAQALDPAIFLS
ncbi:MAG: hypothetical protein Q9170_004010 [Blastenia crenularia]